MQPSTRARHPQDAVSSKHALGPRRKHFFPVLHLLPPTFGDAPAYHCCYYYLLYLRRGNLDIRPRTSTVADRETLFTYILHITAHLITISPTTGPEICFRGGYSLHPMGCHIWYSYLYTRTPAGPDHPTDASRLLSSRAYPCKRVITARQASSGAQHLFPRAPTPCRCNLQYAGNDRFSDQPILKNGQPLGLSPSLYLSHRLCGTPPSHARPFLALIDWSNACLICTLPFPTRINLAYPDTAH